MVDGVQGEEEPGRVCSFSATRPHGYGGRESSMDEASLPFLSGELELVQKVGRIIIVNLA